MKNLLRFNEHILSNDGFSDDSHFLTKISLLNSEDLIKDVIYKYREKIRGNNLIAIVKFIGVIDDKFNFEIVKFSTPRLAALLGLKVGDILRHESWEIPKYYSIK